ncbi:hypothetical protein FRC19_008156 [Serendipita sp. 401]|nr:hypothetical protein FRC19_008156 [Serendipita sp. 401]
MPPERLRQVLIDLLDPKERKGSGSGGGAKGTDPESSGRNGKEVVLNGILRGEIPIVASCGSGMTACVIWLALHELWAFVHPDRRAEINGGEDAGLMRIALYDEAVRDANTGVALQVMREAVVYSLQMGNRVRPMGRMKRLL